MKAGMLGFAKFRGNILGNYPQMGQNSWFPHSPPIPPPHFLLSPLFSCGNVIVKHIAGLGGSGPCKCICTHLPKDAGGMREGGNCEGHRARRAMARTSFRHRVPAQLSVWVACVVGCCRTEGPPVMPPLLLWLVLGCCLAGTGALPPVVDNCTRRPPARVDRVPVDIVYHVWLGTIVEASLPILANNMLWLSQTGLLQEGAALHVALTGVSQQEVRLATAAILMHCPTARINVTLQNLFEYPGILKVWGRRRVLLGAVCEGCGCVCEGGV